MRRLPVAVGLALSLLLGAACGSDSDTDESAGNTGDVDTVKIALVAPLSGAYTMYGKPIEDGARLAVDEVNAGGGISGGDLQGARLELVAFDDQLDPKQAADAAQKVVDDPTIWAYTGLAGSDSALAAKPILNRAGVPLISSYASSPKITEDAERTFIIASPHGAYAYGGVQAAKDDGAQRVAILQITGEFGDSISKLAQDAAKAKGMEVTTVQTMNSGDTDAQVQVLAAKDSGADTLLTVGYGSDVVAAVTAADKLQWDTRIVDIGGGAYDPTVLENGGAATEGLIGVVDYDAASTSEANETFTSAYKAKVGDADVPPPAAHGYETIKAIAAALAMGPSNREELGDDLYDVNLPDTGVGALSFDDNGNPVGRPMWIFHVENGGFVFDQGYTYDGRDVAPEQLAR